MHMHVSARQYVTESAGRLHACFTAPMTLKQTAGMFDQAC